MTDDEVNPIDTPIKRVFVVWLLCILVAMIGLSGCKAREPDWMGHCAKYGEVCRVG